MLGIVSRNWVGKQLIQRNILEQSYAWHLEHQVQGELNLQAFTGNGDQQAGLDSYPNLTLYSVFRTTEELVDPFEQQFDLPTAPIEIADGLAAIGIMSEAGNHKNSNR